MEKKKKKFDDLVTGQSPFLEEAKFREENEEWLDASARIAFAVLTELKKRNMTQKDLAHVMKVSEQYISKLVKGGEKMTIETICKIQSALGIKILADPCLLSGEMRVSKKQYEQVVKLASRGTNLNVARIKSVFKAKQIMSDDASLSIPVDTQELYEEEATR